MDDLGIFHLSGLSGQSEVVRVIDGDTVEMLIYIPLKDLTRKIEYRGRGKARSLKSAASVSSNSTDAGFHAKFICRLAGVDFAEHNTEQGCLGTKLMTDLYAKQNNLVYFKTGKFDKYGRLLIELFFDQDCTRSINRNYAGKTFDRYGCIAESYSGSTKSGYMKTLPKLSLKDIKACKLKMATVSETDFIKNKSTAETGYSWWLAGTVVVLVCVYLSC